MTAYDNDPRVTLHACGCHYDLVCPAGRPGMVWLQSDGSFAARRAGQPVDGRSDVHATADEAIRSLIGDPQ